MHRKQISFFLIALFIGLLFFGNKISFHSSDEEELTENEYGLKDTILCIYLSDGIYKMGTPTTQRVYVDTITTPDAEIKIYHGWNGLNAEWDPYVRYTESIPEPLDRKTKGTKTATVQTFLYERYDLTTQTWIGDLKMETETVWTWQDKEYVREQQYTTKSLWSKELQRWIDTLYIEANYCNYWQEIFCNGKMYELDATSGDKKTLFSYNEEDYGSHIIHFYTFWNTQKNTPESFYKTEAHAHQERMLYVWDYLNLNKEWVLLNGNTEEVERVDQMIDTMMREMYIDPKMVLLKRYLEKLNYSYRDLIERDSEDLSAYSGKIPVYE